jgi:hypothetical protein
MNFNKSKILLNKINALHDSGHLIQGGFSSLERDLFLQYLRELYELATEDIDATRETNQVVYSRPNPAPPMETVYERPTNSAPTWYQEKENHRYPEAMNPSTRLSQHIPSPSPIAQPAPLPRLEQPEQPTKPEGFSEEVEELFDIATLDQLNTSRFNSSPISDIGKSMGINEKILTINELFGGNQQYFNSVIDSLNRLSSFDDAKSYLAREVVEKNAWISGSKKNKAQIFLNLIRRRYQ